MTPTSLQAEKACSLSIWIFFHSPSLEPLEEYGILPLTRGMRPRMVPLDFLLFCQLRYFQLPEERKAAAISLVVYPLFFIIWEIFPYEVRKRPSKVFQHQEIAIFRSSLILTGILIQDLPRVKSGRSLNPLLPMKSKEKATIKAKALGTKLPSLRKLRKEDNQILRRQSLLIESDPLAAN
ncbi:hypothetical protein VNO77_46403 [Canavalia gladiata]|uniref:Uncharacterized protein n=1 Tax=Canavalia gladiata TaxID=3824 RepID=A0AAN9JFI2_CANGL